MFIGMVSVPVPTQVAAALAVERLTAVQVARSISAGSGAKSRAAEPYSNRQTETELRRG